MLSYRLIYSATKEEIIVSLKSDDPNKSARIEYEGDDYLIRVIKGWLEHEYGAFGHLIGNGTTPIDLNAAMHSKNASAWSPEIIEGHDLVKRYDPGIPPGAMT